tara:strand:+ start:190 stop:666 length:477 start_codon:yes stop_codon:yes gene_type:complete
MNKILLALSLLMAQEGYLNNKTLNEIDSAWQRISISVKSGDFDSYQSFYHPDAIMVNKISGKTYPIKEAFDKWKPGFEDTKKGKIKANLSVRFMQRSYDRITAHEEGIFYYYTIDAKGKKEGSYVHFESLWVKKGEDWLMIMENQKLITGQNEWDKLQ